MQKVVLTIDNTKNAYLLLKLIKQFDFVHSIEFNENELDEESEDEIFTNEWADDFFLEDFQLTVKDLRLKTIQDEKERGMSKQDFINSITQWRSAIEK